MYFKNINIDAVFLTVSIKAVCLMRQHDRTKKKVHSSDKRKKCRSGNVTWLNLATIPEMCFCFFCNTEKGRLRRLCGIVPLLPRLARPLKVYFLIIKLWLRLVLPRVIRTDKPGKQQ